MKLQEHIQYIIDAHSNHPIRPSKAFRKWDGKTPYFIHPIWCSNTIATETILDTKTREDGIIVLLYHDVLEDTTKPLPESLPAEIKELIQHMTFESSDREMIEIWEKSIEIKLYKLYDKVSNLIDGSWMDAEKRKKYEDYTQKLLEEVESKYGELNITKIARSVLKLTK